MKKYSGMDWLRVDIGSHWGLDKELFETRIQWVHDNEGKLEKLEDNADDYFRYAAAVMAFRQAQKGIPTGHLVGLDACASGPQILSCLTGCKIGAANTGTTGQQRMDVYGVCTTTMRGLLEGINEIPEGGFDDEEPAVYDYPEMNSKGEWVDVEEVEKEPVYQMKVYARSDIKDAFMPHFYFSKKEPQKVFGKGTKELRAFYNATRIVCPGASGFLDIMGTMWDPEALSYSWVMPDGFTVIKKVTDTVDDRIEIDTMEGHPTFTYRHEVNMTLEKGLFLAADTTHSVDGYIVRELTARCDYDREALLKAQEMLEVRVQRVFTNERPYVSPAEVLWEKHGCLSIEGIETLSWGTLDFLGKRYAEELLSLVQKVLSKPSFKVITIHKSLWM